MATSQLMEGCHGNALAATHMAEGEPEATTGGDDLNPVEQMVPVLLGSHSEMGLIPAAISSAAPCIIMDCVAGLPAGSSHGHSRSWRNDNANGWQSHQQDYWDWHKYKHCSTQGPGGTVGETQCGALLGISVISGVTLVCSAHSCCCCMGNERKQQSYASDNGQGGVELAIGELGSTYGHAAGCTGKSSKSHAPPLLPVIMHQQVRAHPESHQPGWANSGAMSRALHESWCSWCSLNQQQPHWAATVDTTDTAADGESGTEGLQWAQQQGAARPLGHQIIRCSGARADVPDDGRDNVHSCQSAAGVETDAAGSNSHHAHVSSCHARSHARHQPMGRCSYYTMLHRTVLMLLLLSQGTKQAAWHVMGIWLPRMVPTYPPLFSYEQARCTTFGSCLHALKDTESVPLCFSAALRMMCIVTVLMYVGCN